MHGLSNAFVVVLLLLYLILKLSSAKLSHFNDIYKAFGRITFLLEPKGPVVEGARASFTV
jgi:hypothetical protein